MRVDVGLADGVGAEERQLRARPPAAGRQSVPGVASADPVEVEPGGQKWGRVVAEVARLDGARGHGFPQLVEQTPLAEACGAL